MKYGLFSDIHGNMEALEVVLDFFKKNNINSFICCGDIVGYGPNPNECIEIVNSLENIFVVAGNHDYACSGYKEIKWFNEPAQEAILWTRRRLKERYLLFLTELPKMIVEKDLTIVHGSPRDPIDEYLINKIYFISSLSYFSTTFCFVGHTHVPVIFMHGQEKVSTFISPEPGTKTVLDMNNRYIINIGSVGQPRDSDPRACCAIFDSDTIEITFYRHRYNVQKTQKKMRKARLPEYLIERLAFGK